METDEARRGGGEVFEEQVPEEYAGLRVDAYLAERIEDATRSFIKKLIKGGQAFVNGRACARPSRNVAAGETVRLFMPPPPDVVPAPENIPIEILHEDQDLAVVNKPAGLVVHPAPGHYTGTLVNALLYHCPGFERSGDDAARPGIVHRLDRDTSGVMVVAKSQKGFVELARQAREHSFDRRYLALVRGEFPEDRGVIDAPMGRSSVDRKRMAVTGVRARDAVTHFEVLERFGVASLLALRLETGRTHQVRVHLRFTGHHVLGDRVYGMGDRDRWDAPDAVRAAVGKLRGQALHAERLGLTHPRTGERMAFSSPPPPDFSRTLQALRALRAP